MKFKNILPHKKNTKLSVNGIIYQVSELGIIEIPDSDTDAINKISGNSVWVRIKEEKKSFRSIQRNPIANPVSKSIESIEQKEDFSPLNRRELIKLCAYKNLRKQSELNQMKKSDLIDLLEGK
ncbi:hypothetical protein A2V94_07095 [Candidatus Atribacteria bacterium RBG_16_35_8]|nr:MAG: hypothetical protein A2V94_07095 [Candidatus Atribacteria bacterium RBG_16_35_8]